MEKSENKGIGITLNKIMLAEWGMTVQVILFQMTNAKKNNHLNDYSSSHLSFEIKSPEQSFPTRPAWSCSTWCRFPCFRSSPSIPRSEKKTLLKFKTLQRLFKQNKLFQNTLFNLKLGLVVAEDSQPWGGEFKPPFCWQFFCGCICSKWRRQLSHKILLLNLSWNERLSVEQNQNKRIWPERPMQKL